MPARNKNPPPPNLDNIELEMVQIFDQAQGSTANHQKNFVALHKLHLQACLVSKAVNRGFKLTGERRFEDVFLCSIFRTRTYKKGITPADRTLRFAGGYVGFCNRRVDEDEAVVDETGSYASRLAKRVVNMLCTEARAKDKLFRYRAIQGLAEILGNLPDLEDETYESVRTTLLERVKDKESTVRVQAVIALSKLIGTDDDTSDCDDNGEQLTALKRITECMHQDPSPDVRRAAMSNLPVTEGTLNDILKRTRDVDIITRKMVYSVVLPKGLVQVGQDGESTIGPSHPKALNIEQRELVANNGFGDREPSVQSAAATLMGKWLDSLSDEDCIIKTDPDGDLKVNLSSNVKKLTAILSLFVLQDESKTAKDVLLALFDNRTELFESLDFDDNYWKVLNPETIFLARVYVDYCISNKDQARLEDALPVVTALAFRIQETYNALLDSLRDDVAQDVDDAIMDAQFEKEFIISEMLRIAVNLDFSDELGRRKMYDLTRDMLGGPMLPEGLIPGCLDVMRKLSFDERDLIRVIVGMVQDLRDPQGDDEDADMNMDDDDDDEDEDNPKPKKPRSSLFHKPMQELTPDEQIESDEVDLRCLTLCIHMLERIMGTLEEHASLDGIIKELIIPSVQRKDLTFRTKGLQALGLVSLIARTMANQSLPLFIKQIDTSPPDLQILILKVIFDTVMVHNQDFLDVPENRVWIKDYFIGLLVDTENPLESQVQFLVCEGLAKLALVNMLDEEDVLLILWRAFIDPSTVKNQQLRQCLAYFFPAYASASQRGQRKLCDIFPSIFKAMDEMRMDLEDGARMSTASQIIGMFTEWIDPHRVQLLGLRETVDEDLHVDFAISIVKIMLDPDDAYSDYLLKEDKKALCQALPKLYLPDSVDDLKIRNLKVLVNGLRTRKALPDAVARNAVNKLETLISKKYEDQLSAFTEEEWAKMDELSESFNMVELADDKDEVEVPKRRGRKRTSESMTSDAESEVSTVGGKSKRRRVSVNDDEDYETQEPPAPKGRRGKRGSQPPTRSIPKRSAAAAVKKKIEEAYNSTREEEEEEEDAEEDDEEEEEEEESTPAPQSKQARLSRETIESMDEDNLATPRPKRRIADEDEDDAEDESEDEVNDILADD